MPSWVYKIVKDDEVIYVGSTKRQYFCQRKGDHTKPTTATQGHQPILQNYVKENGGWNNFTFEVIEEYEDILHTELLQREKHFINLLKPKCNVKSPLETKEEHNKRKYEEHQQRMLNPEYKQRYYDKQKQMQSHIDYTIKRCSTVINCECGGTYTLQNKTNHFKRNIHKIYFNV